MKVNPELEVLSKLSEIFSDVKYISYQGDITVELTGISHDFQELSELLLPEKKMGTSAPTVKTDNPVVRRDSLGADSIGRKYIVMSDDDYDFSKGTVVTGVKESSATDPRSEGGADGTIFITENNATSYYMHGSVLLQEITEGDSN